MEAVWPFVACCFQCVVHHDIHARCYLPVSSCTNTQDELISFTVLLLLYGQSPYLDYGFRGFDSSIILILRGGIPRPVGKLPEILSQQILAGRFLVYSGNSGNFGIWIPGIRA